jgi:hypothetical protein
MANKKTQKQHFITFITVRTNLRAGEKPFSERPTGNDIPIHSNKNGSDFN